MKKDNVTGANTAVRRSTSRWDKGLDGVLQWSSKCTPCVSSHSSRDDGHPPVCSTQSHGEHTVDLFYLPKNSLVKGGAHVQQESSLTGAHSKIYYILMGVKGMSIVHTHKGSILKPIKPRFSSSIVPKTRSIGVQSSS